MITITHRDFHYQVKSLSKVGAEAKAIREWYNGNIDDYLSDLLLGTELLIEGHETAGFTAVSEVFEVGRGIWLACWKGKMATATFNSQGAAQAWIDTCNNMGKWRS